MLRSIWYQKAPVEIVIDRFPGLKPYERNIRTLISLARQDVLSEQLARSLPGPGKRQENTNG